MDEFKYSSIFGELTRIVQLRFDAISKLHKQLFDNVIFEKYFTWDTPSRGLSFEEIIGLYNITIAAATIGDNSKEPIIGTEAPETFKQKVLHHAITKSMTTQTYRKILELQDSRFLDDATKKNELINLMWGDVQTVVGGVLARIDMIVLNALSNEGIAILDKENNPEGGVQGVINYCMPDANKFTASVNWSKENSDSIDVLQDINNVVDAAQDYVVFDKILADPSVISYICQTALVKRAIWGSDKSASMVTMPTLNNYLQSVGLPQFEPIRRQIRVTDHGSVTVFKPWNSDNVVFIPSGKLGVIKNSYVDNELKQEPGVAYSNYGRVRVSQWGAGETQVSNGVEFVKAQVLALPVFTEINGIYSLNTQPTAKTSVNPTGVSAEADAGVSTLDAKAGGASTKGKTSKK